MKPGGQGIRDVSAEPGDGQSTGIPDLEVRDVHTYYGDSYVLQGASLSVPRGVVAGLLGRNGMGKTTLVRTIAGLTPSRRGEIGFRGQPIERLPPYEIARLGIALVPQGRRIFGSLRTIENLTLPASKLARRTRAVGPDAWDVKRVFELFPHLERRQFARAGTLSGGEAQMLAIGRALMANPELLIMDEPSEGLAPVIIDEIRRVVLELKDRRLSVLLVEQNLELAVAVCDLIYILSEGQVVYEGEPEEFARRDDIRHQYLGI